MFETLKFTAKKAPVSAIGDLLQSSVYSFTPKLSSALDVVIVPAIHTNQKHVFFPRSSRPVTNCKTKQKSSPDAKGRSADVDLSTCYTMGRENAKKREDIDAQDSFPDASRALG